MLNLLKDFLHHPLQTRRRGRRILRHLIDSSHLVTFEELIDLIWGHQEDGGPLTAENGLKVEISQIRKNLKPGVRIKSYFGRGYRLEITKEFAECHLLKLVARKLGLEER